MCDPVSLGIATLALTGVTAGVGFYGAHKESQKQQEQNDAFYAANKKAAIDAAVLNSRELGLRQSEELLATATQQQDVSLKEQAALSTARTSAAEAGITGHSVDAVMNDISTQGSAERSRIQTNSELQVGQLQREKEAVLVDAQNNINTARQTQVRNPSILTPIIDVGNAALKLADDKYARTPRTTQPVITPTATEVPLTATALPQSIANTLMVRPS